MILEKLCTTFCSYLYLSLFQHVKPAQRNKRMLARLGERINIRGYVSERHRAGDFDLPRDDFELRGYNMQRDEPRVPNQFGPDADGYYQVPLHGVDTEAQVHRGAEARVFSVPLAPPMPTGSLSLPSPNRGGGVAGGEGGDSVRL